MINSLQFTLNTLVQLLLVHVNQKAPPHLKKMKIKINSVIVHVIVIQLPGRLLATCIQHPQVERILIDLKDLAGVVEPVEPDHLVIPVIIIIQNQILLVNIVMKPCSSDTMDSFLINLQETMKMVQWEPLEVYLVLITMILLIF